MYSSLAIATALLAGQPAEDAALETFDVPAACQVQQAALQAIETKYEPETSALEEEGSQIEGHHISGEIKFKERKFSFDVPSVTMKPNKMSMKIPSVTMRSRTMAWHNPTVVMKTTLIGKVPDGFTCTWVKCKVKYKNVYTDMPHTEMRRKEISTSLPEVTLVQRDFITNSPQVKMKTVRWSTRVPEFTVDSPIPETGPGSEGKALEAKAEALAARVNEDVATSAAALYDCLSADLVEKRRDVALQFDVAINQMTAAITTISAAGADPSAVEIDGQTVNLMKQREDLIGERDQALASIDQAIESMGKNSEQTVLRAVG